jgi:hypothetical protein
VKAEENSVPGHVALQIGRRSFDHDLAVVDDHQAVTERIGLF